MDLADFKNQRGATRAGTIFVTLICGCLIYAAWQVLPFYYYYYELQGLMEAQVRVSSDKTEEQIRKNLLDRINELEIPIRNEGDIRITRSGKSLYIELDYTEVLWFSFNNKDYIIKEFDFLAKAGVDPRE